MALCAHEACAVMTANVANTQIFLSAHLVTVYEFLHELGALSYCRLGTLCLERRRFQDSIHSYWLKAGNMQEKEFVMF